MSFDYLAAFPIVVSVMPLRLRGLLEPSGKHDRSRAAFTAAHAPEDTRVPYEDEDA
jgi:hypothetical protein